MPQQKITEGVHQLCILQVMPLNQVNFPFDKQLDIGRASIKNQSAVKHSQKMALIEVQFDQQEF